MPSICLYTVLFTLADKAVEKNPYVQMLELWLFHILQNKILVQGDKIILVIDGRTYNIISNSILNICQHFPFSVGVLIVQPPKTLIEGCSFRYNTISYTQDILLYTDIDILIRKPLHPFFETLSPNSTLLHPEDWFESSDYNADFTETELQDPNIQGIKLGISSGKFAFTNKDIYLEFIQEMQKILKKNDPKWKTYYTLDQPLFNRCVIEFFIKNHPDYLIESLEPPFISSNFDNFSSEQTLFLDSCGEPGEGQIHIQKQMHAFIRLGLEQIHH